MEHPQQFLENALVSARGTVPHAASLLGDARPPAGDVAVSFEPRKGKSIRIADCGVHMALEVVAVHCNGRKWLIPKGRMHDRWTTWFAERKRSSVLQPE